MKRLKHAAASAAFASALGFSGAVGAGGGFAGLGGSVQPDYEGSDDYEGGPALFGNWTFDNGMFVDLGGTPEAGMAARLKANLIPSRWSERWQAGVLAQYRQGRKGVDEDRVDDLKNIEHTGEAGAFVSFLYERWQFNLKTRSYTASGTYLVYLDTGDPLEYEVFPVCEAAFVVE